MIQTVESQKTFSKQLSEIKKANEDFEWYPTTTEILNKFLLVAREKGIEARRWDRNYSLLDIGAGNGKVLDFALESELFKETYAIEKSQTHLSALDPRHNILGVDFHKVTLIDKSVDFIYSNPPYSEYDIWMEKIINEVLPEILVFLVVPERWKSSERISAALRSREIKAEVVGSFDFLSSEDRAARAKVDLVYFRCKKCYDDDSKDPFSKFFDQNFTYPEKKERKKFEERLEERRLSVGGNLIEILCSLYDGRMAELEANYTAVCSLDRGLLQEFSISRSGLIESLKMKIKELKKSYCQRLFDGISGISNHLTNKSRKAMVSKLNDQTGLDFNIENCYAIITWAIKNANHYFDKQLIETYESLVDFCNVENYRSNERVFTDRLFRYDYMRSIEGPTHYKLKVGHRMVLEGSGGLYNGWRGVELSESAVNMIGDLLVVARNMGFEPLETAPNTKSWNTSEPQIFHCTYKNEKVSLFRVRTFLNGNMHFQFLPEFVHALNIQHGILKGWLNAGTAAAETGAPSDLVEELLPKLNFKLGVQQFLLA